MNHGTPTDPEHILPADRITAWKLQDRNGKYTEHDVFELRLNLTDKQIEPAARELFNINDRGNPRGYIPFEQITEDEYNDYMTKAQYAVEGFLKGLEKAEDD